ncbi:hypothetical protein SMICM304S_12225 [Streptomyces microflavus]
MKNSTFRSSSTKSTKQKVTTSGGYRNMAWTNTNKMLSSYSGAIGVKTRPDRQVLPGGGEGVRGAQPPSEPHGRREEAHGLRCPTRAYAGARTIVGPGSLPAIASYRSRPAGRETRSPR